VTATREPTDEATHARALAARLRSLDFAETDPPSGVRALEQALERFAAARSGPGGESARVEAWGAIATSVEALAAALENEQRARAIDRMRLAEGLRWVSNGIDEAERLTTRVAELEREVQARDAEARSREARVATLEGEVRARDAAIAAAIAQAQQLAERVSGLDGELEAARNEVRAREASIAEIAAERERLMQEGSRLQAGMAGLESEKARLESELARFGEEAARLRGTLAQPGHRLVTRMGATLERHPRIGATVSAIVRGLNRLFGP
jgi:chromosome segregation ATPase